MILNLHPNIAIQKLTIGSEGAPLLVIDNFIAEPQKLVQRASWRQFNIRSPNFPGIRSEGPLSYRNIFTQQLSPLLAEYFQLPSRMIRITACYYSLITTPAQELEPIQRIPHIDSVSSKGLASVHYLFKGNLGGTAFYRHRKTGFEYVDESRREIYFQAVEEESAGPNAPRPGYIDGDTPLYEQIGKQEGIFNRVLIYRRNSLHSGSIDPNFVPDPNPLTGRLSLNTFMETTS